VRREVSGLCLKLHYCTPGLVRSSAGSTPYKGTTSPIPIEPLLLLLLLLLAAAAASNWVCLFAPQTLIMCILMLHHKNVTHNHNTKVHKFGNSCHTSLNQVPQDLFGAATGKFLKPWVVSILQYQTPYTDALITFIIALCY